MTQNRVKEAAESFVWLRGKSVEAMAELKNLVKKHEMQKKEEDTNSVELTLLDKTKANVMKPEFLKPLVIILFFFFVT